MNSPFAVSAFNVDPFGAEVHTELVRAAKEDTSMPFREALRDVRNLVEDFKVFAPSAPKTANTYASAVGGLLEEVDRILHNVDA